ncbi:MULTISPECIES: nitroreductase family protein [Methanobrevibacter]|uniref:nitroreductase family protein n=1 Tax=Methanobrevibacter TaxID=2172 RepID=UPI0015BC014E|nr:MULTISPECIES: nitroreductase family protein [Methanobrevibacter]MBS7257656.1 nitroreductase [Methanobrevibacter sp.]MCI7428185.1 nitroreductase [Methanobrevibacter sp.]MDY3097732.1 nitroreductase family protein [Methanobrevibacter sp.]
MKLEEQIYLRKSCRKYLDEPVNLDLIDEFMSNVKPLNEDIKYRYEFLKQNEVSSKMHFKAPYYLAIYSEIKENYMVNAGFIFQQLCLYLQSQGIGSCWLGLGSPKKKDSEFVILISFGKSDDMTRTLDEFKRNNLSKISDEVDESLIPAQLAPSAMNSQPWYFKHTVDGFDVYQVKQNIIKRQLLKRWNPIDMGIAISHMYIANENTFEFKIKDNFDELKGYTYIGSIKI